MTTNIEIKRFTQPDVLGAISIKHLGRFFDRFTAQLQGRNLPLPAEHALAGTEGFYDSWIALLKSPEKLPDSLLEAVLAIEQLAAPENTARLQEAVALAPPELYLDPASLPECLALQIWLMAPYKMVYETAVPFAQPRPVAHPMGNGSIVEDAGERSAAPGAVPDHQRLVPPTRIDETECRPGPGEGGLVAPKSDEGGSTHSTTNSQLSTNPSPNSEPQTPNSELPISNSQGFRRHTGKIGRLPHEVRDSINFMIYDSVPYKEIFRKLGDSGEGLKPYHLTRWKKNGYREWLQEQQRKDQAHAKEEFALHILREKDAGKVHEAYLQMAGSQLCQFMADFDPAVLKEKLQNDPLNFVRFLNALSKLSESGIKCESHRVEIAERQVKLEKEKAPPLEVGLSPEVRRIIEEERFYPPSN